MDELKKRIGYLEEKVKKLTIEVIMQGKLHRKYFKYAKCGKAAPEAKFETEHQKLIKEYTVNWE